MTIETTYQTAVQASSNIRVTTTNDAAFLVDFMSQDKLPTIEINRDVQQRVNKMVPIFKNPTATQSFITIFNVKNDIVVETPFEDVGVKAGFKLADGNTRRLFWSANNEYIPHAFVLTFIDILVIPKSCESTSPFLVLPKVRLSVQEVSK